MNKFTDVTIAIEDDTILAHRVVLSACSTYFFSILGRYHFVTILFQKSLTSQSFFLFLSFKRLGDCPHPVIVLREPSPKIMKKLVDYMYTGKMSVSPKVRNIT